LSFLVNSFFYTVPSTELWAVTGTGQNEGFTGGITIIAQRISTGQVLIGKTVTRYDLSIRKVGAPTGNITGKIINSSNVEQLNMGTLDASTLTTSFVTYTFENSSGYTIADGDRLAIFYSSGDDSNYPDWSMNTSSESNTNGSYYTGTSPSGSWTERSRDATISVWGY
jgi:hypothetical protein